MAKVRHTGLSSLEVEGQHEDDPVQWDLNVGVRRLVDVIFVRR